MLLTEIILKLRAANTSFESLIGGAVEFAIALKNTLMQEMAFVIPYNDTASPQKNDFGINQQITEKFSIVVAIKNDTSVQDKLGMLAYNRLHNIRAEFWTAILGWLPTGAEHPISYAGGKVMDITPAWLWYEFTFSYVIRIDDDDGIVQEDLDYFNTIYGQWVLSPDINIPISEPLLLTSFTADAEDQIDLTEDPDAGAFSSAFNVIFDTYTG